MKIDRENLKNFCVGDILKIYHFTGSRNKKHYMYKLITNSEEGLQVVDIASIAEYGVGCHRTNIITLLNCEVEIIHRAI